MLMAEKNPFLKLVCFSQYTWSCLLKIAMDVWPGDLCGNVVFFPTAERVVLVPEQRRV